MPKDQERTISPEEERAIARQKLLDYLDHGQRNEEREINVIYGRVLRDLILRAGYTGLACIWNGLGQKDLGISQGHPSKPENKMTINGTDAVEYVKMKISNEKPDFPAGQDPRQNIMVPELDRVEELRRESGTLGKKYSISGWVMDDKNGMRHFLTPANKDENFPGFYKLQEIDAWIKGDPNSPIRRRFNE